MYFLLESKWNDRESRYRKRREKVIRNRVCMNKMRFGPNHSKEEGCTADAGRGTRSRNVDKFWDGCTYLGN